jgi:hypothetical protein
MHDVTLCFFYLSQAVGEVSAEKAPKKDLEDKDVIKNILLQPGLYVNPRKASKAFSSNYGVSIKHYFLKLHSLIFE